MTLEFTSWSLPPGDPGDGRAAETCRDSDRPGEVLGRRPSRPDRRLHGGQHPEGRTPSGRLWAQRWSGVGGTRTEPKRESQH